MFSKDDPKEPSERQLLILDIIRDYDLTIIHQMTPKINVSEKTIKREFDAIRKLGININRQDGRKEGRWVILNKKE